MKASKLFLYAVIAAMLIGGCGGKPQAPPENKIYLTLDFEKAGPLRYKFTSSRQIEVLFQDPTATKQEKPSEYSESFETVISYNPIKVNPYGLSEIEATIESISGHAALGAKQEATESLKGKKFKFLVGPTGKAEDKKEILDLIKQTAKAAFRSSKGSATIKEPDLISDFAASQMFLWDSIASIKQPQKGIAVGESWQSRLSIPSPMPELFNAARDVNYTLESVKDTKDGRIAVINSRFSPSNSVLDNLFIPYEGNFMLAGPFGLYVGCQVASLEGGGQELFNIDQGKDISCNQNYKMVVNSTMSLIPVKIRITINQELSMQLIGNSGQ